VLDIELVTAQHAVVAIELVPLEAPGDAAEEGLHRHERAADAEPGDAEDGRAGMTPPTASRSLARSAVDWGLLSVGVMAMGTAFTLDLLAFRHAENLGRYDPAAPGFLNASVQYRRIRGAGFGMGIGGSAALLVTVSSRTWFDSDRFRWGALSAGVPASILGVVLFVRTPRRIADTTLTEPHRALGALLLGVGVSLSLVPLSAWLRRRIRRGLDRRIVVTPTLAGLELLGRF